MGMRSSGIWALALHGPFGAIAASALGAESIRLAHSAVWIKEKDKTSGVPRRTAAAWHKDLHNRRSSGQPVIRAWLALTDAREAVEWMAGRHRIPHSCSYSHPSDLSLGVDSTCLEAEWKRKLSDGQLQRRFYNLSKGDAIIFDGGLWHRGHGGHEDRVAIDFGFVPGDM